MTTPPAWLDALVETTVNSMEVHSPSTIGYRYYEADDDEPWELILYPTPVELRGGAEDGAVLAPGRALSGIGNGQLASSVSAKIESNSVLTIRCASAHTVYSTFAVV